MLSNEEIEKSLEDEYEKNCEEIICKLFTEKKSLEANVELLEQRIGELRVKITKFNPMDPKIRKQFFSSAGF